MMTSNFKLSGSDPFAVAITRGTPKWFKGLVLTQFAPTWAMVKMTDQAAFREAYYRQLDQLDVKRILSMIFPEAILLCYEDLSKPDVWCHRRILADYIQERCQFTVSEAAPADPLLPPALSLPQAS